MRELFHFCVRVRPKSDHPVANSFKFGILHMLILASCREDALIVGSTAVVALPFENGDAVCYEWEKWVDEMAVRWEVPTRLIQAAAAARIAGVQFTLTMWPLWVDEFETLGHWPGLVPVMELP